MSGAAAVVVALGVAVPVFAERSGDTGGSAPTSVGAPAAGPAGPFTFTFGSYKVGKLQVAAPISVSTSYQLAPVYADGLTSNDAPVQESDTDPAAAGKGEPGYRPDPNPAKKLWAYLVVYRPGAYDPSPLAGAGPVTIGGRPGVEIADTGDHWPMARTLAWRYADNAWAVLLSRSDDTAHPSADDLRQLAAGLRTEARTPAKLPVKLTYVPAGYTLTEVGVHATTGLNGLASARAGDHAGLLFSRPALPVTGLTGPYTNPDGGNPDGSFAIFVVPSANSNQLDPKPGVTCMNGFCNRWFDNNRVQVQVSSEGLLPNAEMTRILEGITLTNVHDDSTWTEIPRSIPS